MLFNRSEPLFDPDYTLRAKKRISELKDLNDRYKTFYESYENKINDLNDAKVFALKVLKQVENYINTLANRPKEFDGAVVTPNIDKESLDVHETIEFGIKTYKKNALNAIPGILASFATVAFLPAIVISVPVMAKTWFIDPKKRNKKVIAECEEKIEILNREMAKLNRVNNETVTEQEFIFVYSKHLEDALKKIDNTGIKDYLQFSKEQKGDLGVIVNNAQTLIRRLDGRK